MSKLLNAIAYGMLPILGLALTLAAAQSQAAEDFNSSRSNVSSEVDPDKKGGTKAEPASKKQTEQPASQGADKKKN